MVVFTSDHGDNLGDHWLGEKDLFFDCSARVPLIIYDPRQEADATRGTSTDHLVEAIDLVPTFIEALGGTPSAPYFGGAIATAALARSGPSMERVLRK
jgi:arylsulfatase A-like enzyme